MSAFAKLQLFGSKTSIKHDKKDVFQNVPEIQKKRRFAEHH